MPRSTWFKALLLLVALWAPLSQAETGWQPIQETIRKSDKDNRQYQAIRLDNGMVVLLVSDPQAVKSLSALVVPVGSLEDPEAYQGLAHYLEHMSLMGSKKYPQADSLAEYLKMHGGSHNASTAPYRTAFYLEVENDALPGAVDRLADAIAEPLLDKKYAERERNAVNAELTMARSRDGMRMAQVSAETINPSHPGSKFSGGKLETISDKPGHPVQQALKDLHEKYYSDNLMKEVIYSNKPLVLLVSDPQAVKSLSALVVPVGSLEDPEAYQGLAHYLEHMSLMGSKKYPQADSLAGYLKMHGGSHNASTAPYRTAFYLEVENDALPGAVDRLADAIAEPLLDKKYAERERNAVNAELTMARTRDGMRMAQVSAETINPAHPGSKFSGGNLETLSDKPGNPVQQALKDFHEKYYSANLMKAVIYSNKPLPELAKMAADTFGRVPNKESKKPEITVPVVTDAQKGIIIHYVPALPRKVLRVEFRIDNNSAKFRSKTDELITYLIGNRSPGTLSDWLQKQGLVEGISANSDPIVNGNSGVLAISASLTDKGLANRDQVVAAIFSYLNLLREKEFRIDNNSAKFRSKTDELITYLIGNRSPGTLSDWLQKQGLVEGISANSDPIVNGNSGVLAISASLTDKGLANRDQVVAAIFSYLNLLREKGIDKQYFDELANVLDIDFRYPSITRDMDYVEWLADTMIRVPVEHTLDAVNIADRYDAKAVKERLAMMTPQNARIWYISPKEPHNWMQSILPIGTMLKQ